MGQRWFESDAQYLRRVEREAAEVTVKRGSGEHPRQSQMASTRAGFGVKRRSMLSEVDPDLVLGSKEFSFGILRLQYLRSSWVSALYTEM